MILICDNDIVLKLTAFGLLDDVIQSLEGEQIFVLEAARYRLRKPGRQTRRAHSEETIARALEFCKTSNALSEEVTDEDAVAMGSASYFNADGQECKIDGGELALFSKAYYEPSSYLLTGDKRALYALGKHREVETRTATIHRQMTGRVVCLESSLELCICELGFETARARIVPNCNCDSATRAAFGSGLKAEETNVRNALNSYIVELEKTVGTGWIWRP